MKPFPVHHNHREFVEKIAQRQAKKERRAEIGKAMLKGVARVFGRNKEKVLTKSTSPPSKSSYIQNKRTSNARTIGDLSPTVTPPNQYINAKREASRNYQYTSQRQKIKAPYKTR